MFEGILFCVVMVLVAVAVISAYPTATNPGEAAREAPYRYRLLLNAATLPLGLFALAALLIGLGQSMTSLVVVGAVAFVLGIHLRSSVIPRLAGREPWRD
jgi:hypothetical protein